MPARDNPSERGSDWEGLPSVVDRDALDDLAPPRELRRPPQCQAQRLNASLADRALVNEAWRRLPLR
jgi:hypothetical protein